MLRADTRRRAGTTWHVGMAGALGTGRTQVRRSPIPQISTRELAHHPQTLDLRSELRGRSRLKLGGSRCRRAGDRPIRRAGPGPGHMGAFKPQTPGGCFNEPPKPWMHENGVGHGMSRRRARQFAGTGAGTLVRSRATSMGAWTPGGRTNPGQGPARNAGYMPLEAGLHWYCFLSFALWTCICETGTFDCRFVWTNIIAGSRRAAISTGSQEPSCQRNANAADLRAGAMKFAHYMQGLERDCPPEWRGRFIKCVSPGRCRRWAQGLSRHPGQLESRE